MKNKIPLLIVALIPILFFFGLVVYSFNSSNFKPNFKFIYSTFNKGSVTPVDYQNCKEFYRKVDKTIVFSDTNADYNFSSLCENKLYIHDVLSNTSSELKKEDFSKYTLINSDYNQTDPDGFMFNNYSNNSNFFLFINNSKLNNAPILAKGFSVFKLKIDAQYVNFISFVQK